MFSTSSGFPVDNISPTVKSTLYVFPNQFDILNVTPFVLKIESKYIDVKEDLTEAVEETVVETPAEAPVEEVAPATEAPKAE